MHPSSSTLPPTPTPLAYVSNFSVIQVKFRFGLFEQSASLNHHEITLENSRIVSSPL